MSTDCTQVNVSQETHFYPGLLSSLVFSLKDNLSLALQEITDCVELFPLYMQVQTLALHAFL